MKTFSTTVLQCPKTGQVLATGWLDDPDSVSAMRQAWQSRGMAPDFATAAPHLLTEAADDAPVFFFDGEEKVLGKRLATWNQKSVGSCVGFGSTRAAQDLMLWEIASGEPEQFPGQEGCPEVTYAGSRVEIGGGGIRGDGSVGVWAAEFFIKFGFTIRGKYGSLDLTTYDESTCRRLGSSGLPTEVENAAKVHPIKAAALTKTADEGWAALGAGKPIAVCSNYGFTMQRDSRGFCRHAAVWNHCMAGRGRFVEPDNGRSIVIGNSWGNYLTDSNDTIRYVDDAGKVQTKKLPEGHFAIPLSVFASMLAQGDSSAFAGFTGWKKTVVDWTP